MDSSNIISNLHAGLKHRPEMRVLIPMGYVPSIPILKVENDILCAEYPFLRYKVTGKPDETLVYPIRFTLTYELPEYRVVEFKDLAVDTRFGNVNFNKPCSKFRHEAIRSLDKDAFASLKENTLSGMDKVVAALVNEAPYYYNDEKELVANLSKIIDPALYPFYRALSPEFYNKYLKKDEQN